MCHLNQRPQRYWTSFTHLVLVVLVVLVGVLLGALTRVAPCAAQGDSQPPDFGEDRLASPLKQRLRGAPRGRLLKVIKDSALAWGPFVRTPDSIWMGRRSESRRGRWAELVELNSTGERIRIHPLNAPWGPDPAFSSLGGIVGINGRRLSTWSPSGKVLWRSSARFTNVRYIHPQLDGGVILADAQGVVSKLDAQGRAKWSYALKAALRSAPLVLPSGASIFCVEPSGSLVALHPEGTLAWRDAKARCSQSPTQTPTGDLVVPGHHVLRFYSSAGVRRRSVSVPGVLGPAHVAQDGSLALTSSHGIILGLSPKGTARWTFPLGGKGPGAQVYSSPTGDLITISAEGYLLNLRRNGSLRWYYPVPSPASTLWVRIDGAVLVLTPRFGLRLVGPPPTP